MTGTGIAKLLDIMARLRDPESGCPWDVEQTFQSVAPHTIEEAYEVYDAVQSGSYDDLKEELGDLLFQVVFHARIAQEKGLFSFDDVVDTLIGKLVRRHPHVFSQIPVPVERSADAVKTLWESIKKQERRAKSGGSGSLLADVPKALPALSRSAALGRRAAQVGFDWPTISRVLEKVEEERQELNVELENGADPEKTRGELGDLLFVLAQLARKLDIDPEEALRGTNVKFETRFSHIEETLRRRNRTLSDASLEEMEEIWQDAKKRRRDGSGGSAFA